MKNHTQFFSDLRNKDADEMVGLLRSIGKDFLKKIMSRDIYIIKGGKRRRKKTKKTRKTIKRRRRRRKRKKRRRTRKKNRR